MLFIGSWMINATYDAVLVLLMLPRMTRKSKICNLIKLEGETGGML